jgi:hypothetical protein
VSQLFNSFKNRAIHERKACDTPKLSEDEKLICEQQNSLRNIPRCAGYEKEQREEPLLNETMNVENISSATTSLGATVQKNIFYTCQKIIRKIVSAHEACPYNIPKFHIQKQHGH